MMTPSQIESEKPTKGYAERSGRYMEEDDNPFPELRANMPPDSALQVRNAYDCQSAAIIRWSSQTFKIVSSPNMSWIPEFPDFDDRGLFQRADGHWGPHEYSIWPQIYCNTLVHHICIPRRIPDPPMHEILRKDGIVWREVKTADWIESGPSPFELFTEPIGKLDLTFSNELSRALELTISTCMEVEGGYDKEQKSLVLNIANQARLAVEQLKREPRAERDVIQRVREVQRSIRELFGLYFFAVHIAQNSDACSLPQSAVEHPHAFRGVFVDDGALAEELRRARIPVWFIRPYESIFRDTHIYRVVDPTPWDTVLDRHPWRSREDGRELFMAITPSSYRPVNIRSGRNSLLTEAGMVAIIASMKHAMGRDQGLNRDPLEVGTYLKKRSRENIDLPVTPRLSDSDGERPWKTLKPERKRRPKAMWNQIPVQSSAPLSFSVSFILPAHLPDVPKIPGLWQIALERVSPLPVYRDAPARYQFPPIHLFGFQSFEKTYEHIHNWIRIKPFCERAALKQSVYLTEPGGLKIQDWRIALLGDYTKGQLPLDRSVATPSLERLIAAMPSRNDLVPKIDPTAIGKSRSKIARNAHQQTIKVIFAVEGQFAPYSRSCKAMWAGRSISYNDICSNAKLRARVLWDVCECQFRMDLIDADRVMTGMDTTGDSMAAGLRAYSAQQIWRDVDGSPRLFPEQSGEIHDIWFDNVDRRLLNGLIEVLRCWPGSPEWMMDFHSKSQSEDTCRRALQDSLIFYVEKFVEKFRRLPSPPVHAPL